MNINLFKISLVVIIQLFLSFKVFVFAQDGKKTRKSVHFPTGSIAVSHAPSAWLSGFAGPELEMNYRYRSRSTVFAAFRQVLYHTTIQNWGDYDFTKYYHSIRSGFQLRAGLGLSMIENGPEFIRFSMEYGSFKQAYHSRVCGSWTLGPSAYCLCNRIDDRRDELTQTRITGRMEFVIGIIRRKKWGIESNAGFGAYINRYSNIPLMEAPTCRNTTYELYSSLENGAFILLDGVPIFIPSYAGEWGLGLMPSFNLRIYYILSKNG
jgi:hypothetical protein